MIDDAQDMLLHGIVLGELNTERNVVEVKIRPEHEVRMDGETMTHVDAITADLWKPRLCNFSQNNVIQYINYVFLYITYVL